MQVSIKEIVSYSGHSIKQNGNMELTFTAKFDQVTESMQLLQLLNNDVKITSKLAGQKPVKLGVFTIRSISFKGTGESTIKFISLTDYVEMDNINSIISQENFQIRFDGNVEDVDKEGEDNV